MSGTEHASLPARRIPRRPPGTRQPGRVRLSRYPPGREPFQSAITGPPPASAASIPGGRPDHMRPAATPPALPPHRVWSRPITRPRFAPPGRRPHQSASSFSPHTRTHADAPRRMAALARPSSPAVDQPLRPRCRAPAPPSRPARANVSFRLASHGCEHHGPSWQRFVCACCSPHRDSPWFSSALFFAATGRGGELA